MNFEPSEEQLMLKDSVTKFIQQEYDIDKRRALASSELAYSKENWETFANLGWLTVPFAEKLGGYGGNIIDVAVIMEEFGKGPYVETVVLSGGLLAESLEQGENPAHSEAIEQILGGGAVATAALVEEGTRFSPYSVALTAESSGDGYVLQGKKVNVPFLPSADFAIVSARTSGDQNDEAGISLFKVDLSAAGVSTGSYKLMDGRRAGDLVLDNVQLASDCLLGKLDEGAALLQKVLPLCTLAECAEAVGIMEFLNKTTLEYTKVRKQFGMPIGSFQALQHRMVDTFIEFEQCKSLLFRALISWQDNSDEFPLDLAALKVQVGRSGKSIASEAIQLHGGMGLTDELSIGHYMKRLRMINASYGDADYHQKQYQKLAFAS